MSPKRLQTHPLLPLPTSSFSSPVHLLPLHQSRHLALHGPLILLSKPSNPTIKSTKLLHLSPASPPLPLSKRQLQLASTRLSFPTPALRDAFLSAARAVLQRTSHGISHYDLGLEIGRGASASVYLVRRKRDRALFAMKTLTKKMAWSSAADLESVLLERVVLSDAARRHSPFVVRLVDCFETPTHLCFVTELAEYGALRQLLLRAPQARLPQRLARRLFAEMLLGLEEIHSMGYLYRDMKPGNILVTNTGHVRIADFGVAKKMQLEFIGSEVSSDESSEDEEEEGMLRLMGKAKSFVGTRRYMAPEMLEMDLGWGGDGYGVEADIWGLGVTLYVMVVGEYPFGGTQGGGDTATMVRSIREGGLRFPRWVGKELRDLISGMLTRNVAERIDLEKVKAHPWLKGIDWAQVKWRAQKDVIEEQVVSELGKLKEIEFRECKEARNVLCSKDNGSSGGIEDVKLACFDYIA